jgi:hypothetical protein
MSTSARHNLYFAKEDTYGALTGSGDLKKVRHTGTTLALGKTTHVSEEIKSNRQIQDFRHGQKQIGGTVDFELSYGSLDEQFEAALGGTWAAKFAPYVIASLVISNAGTLTAASSFVESLEVGDVIQLSGGDLDSANAGMLRVTAAGTGQLSVVGLNTLVSETATNVTVTCLTQELKAGVERRSFTAMREFTDQTAEPLHFLFGLEINNLSLKVPLDGIVTGSMSYVGKSLSITDSVPPNTLVESNDNRVFDSFTGVLQDGNDVLATVTEFSFTLENGITPRFAVGSDEVIGPGTIGRSNASGQIVTYFEDADLLRKFIDESQSSLKTRFIDRDLNAYRIKFPKVVYNGGQPDVKGAGEVMTTLPFQAIYDPVTGTNIIITRSPKLV